MSLVILVVKVAEWPVAGNYRKSGKVLKYFQVPGEAPFENFKL